MKYLFIVLAIFASSLAFAQQKKFHIKGKIGNLNHPALIYLFTDPQPRGYEKEELLDSAILVNGKFEFTGNFDSSDTRVKAALTLFKEGSENKKWWRKYDKFWARDKLSFYFDEGIMQINSSDSVCQSIIIGSKVNDDDQKLNNLLKPVMVLAAKKNAITQKNWNDATDSVRSLGVFQAKKREAHALADQSIDAVRVGFIQANPNSIVSLHAIKKIDRLQPILNVSLPLFNSLSTAIKETSEGKEYAAYLESLSKLTIGFKAPDFTQPDVNGKPVSLKDYKGKYLLLDFYSAGCGPCQIEYPYLRKAYLKYKNNSFDILGVSTSMEKHKSYWLEVIKKHGLIWTQVSDLKASNEAAKLYKVRSLPQNFLIDPNGIIIARDLKGDEIEETLSKLLKQ